MSQTQRIKVNVADLIEAVKANVEEAKKKHAADLKKFEVSEKDWKITVMRKLSAALASAKKGTFPQRGYGGRLEISCPDRPYKPTLDLKVANRDLKLLEMAQRKRLS